MSILGDEERTLRFLLFKTFNWRNKLLNKENAVN